MKIYYHIVVKVLIIGFILSSCSQEGSHKIEKEVIHGITMVSIPAGSFMMGHDYKKDPSLPDNVNRYYTDEQPIHEVLLSAFRISETEVTQAQYKAITGENPSTFEGDNLPVTNVGATDALKFCNKLSEAAGLDPCYNEKDGTCDFSKNGFRLPTEAEWEYACRAGTSTLFYTGNTEADLDKAGWYLGNSGKKPHPVAQKEQNAWGLYDMHGNVFEFCYDGYNEALVHKSYPDESITDPTGYNNFNYRIMRGGGWFSESSSCRSFTRSMFWTGGANYYIGFRVVRRPGGTTY